jgi:hypothetical protein
MNDVHNGDIPMFKKIFSSIRNWFRAEARRIEATRREISADQSRNASTAIQRELQKLVRALQALDAPA